VIPDLGQQDAERLPVELIDRVETEQHRQRDERCTAPDPAQ